MLFDPKIKPRLWNLKTGTVAYNCAQMGLPMPVLAMPMWGSGSKVYDYSGNKNTGTISGPIYKPGYLLFDGGATDRVTILNSSVFDVAEGTWVVGIHTTDGSPGAGSEAGIVVSRHDGSSRSGAFIGIKKEFPSEGAFYTQVKDAAGTVASITGTVVLEGNQSHNIAFVFRQASGSKQEVFVDGVSDGSDTASGAWSWAGNDILLGDSLDGWWSAYGGKLFYFLFFPSALTPCQIQTFNNNPFGMFEPIRSPAMWSFQGGQSASLSDNFSLSETFTLLGNYKSSLSDSLSLTESRSAIGKYNRTLSDNMNFSETTSPIGHFLKTISDTLSATDVLSVLASLKASTSDTLNLTDSITVIASLKGTLSDTITLTDNLAALLKALASLSDILTLTDSITYPLGQSASLSDTFSLTDSSTAKAALLAAVSDIFSLTDTASAIASLKAILSDTFSLSDEITTRLIGNLVDTLTLTDSITDIGHFLTTLADTLTLTDSSSGMIHFKVSLSDTLTFSEQISALASYAATIIDTLNLTDDIADVTITITGELTITFSSSKPSMVFTPSKPGITLS